KSSCRLPTSLSPACRFLSRLSVLITRLRDSITSRRISSKPRSVSLLGSLAIEIFLGPEMLSSMWWGALMETPTTPPTVRGISLHGGERPGKRALRRQRRIFRSDPGGQADRERAPAGVDAGVEGRNHPAGVHRPVFE